MKYYSAKLSAISYQLSAISYQHMLMMDFSPDFQFSLISNY
ncbi:MULTISPECIES: hypothetical protein [unclassified Moorena]|nr:MULTISPECIES: hypothetical protein [unclassified Moorena]